MKIFTLIASTLLLCITCRAQVSESDFQALKTFYEATGGTKWTDSRGWDFSKGAESVKSWESEDNSGWYGITIRDERVIGISLSRNNLKGVLPNDICNLEMLKWLSLSNNQLSGTIPEDIGKLTQLYLLSLPGNKLNGSLPSSFINMGKDVQAPKKESDGFDEKSYIGIALQGNKFKNIDTTFLSMPLLKKDCGWEVYLDKKNFKGKTPSYFKKFGDNTVAYGRNYIVERINEDPIFAASCLDELPTFEGKTDVLRFSQYMSEYLVAPKKQVNREQRVVISFVISKDGKVFIRKISGDTRNNARKLLLESEQYWQPGKLNGKPVSTTYSIPIVFNL